MSIELDRWFLNLVIREFEKDVPEGKEPKELTPEERKIFIRILRKEFIRLPPQVEYRYMGGNYVLTSRG